MTDSMSSTFPTFPIPEQEQLRWTQHKNIWCSSGGVHEYVAYNLGEDSSLPNYPWYLQRDDGLGCRATSLEWVKNAAESWEQGLFLPYWGDVEGR